MYSFIKWLVPRGPLRGVCRRECSNLTNELDMRMNGPTRRNLGQPTHETHPHLIGNGEVVPLIKATELHDRRQKLVDAVLAHSRIHDGDDRKHVIIVPSASKQYMSDKIPYVFRQNSDFLYLTGCQEPDTCLLITTSSSGHRSVLFTRDQDAHSELWEGPRSGGSEAVDFFGVDEALPLREFEKVARSHLQSPQRATLWYDFQNAAAGQVTKTLRQYMDGPFGKCWESPKPFVHGLRVIKSKAEIELMKRSCEIASRAIGNCMTMSVPGISEHQLFAKVDYDCRMAGAEILAYPPVIAGSDRATIIHYVNNNQLVNDGEMVLMDAGCEYHGYSSDITRTWPVSGRFSAPQRELYEAVLSVQQELIAMLESQPSLDLLLSAMYLLLGKRLQEVGVVPKSDNRENIMKDGYRFCSHHVSHYLGMDVHDTPSVPRNIGVQPGMIITVEPGCYITRDADVPEEFRGTGIRIEDDVLVTADGPVVLTSRCPKTVAEVERFSSAPAD